MLQKKTPFAHFGIFDTVVNENHPSVDTDPTTRWDAPEKDTLRTLRHLRHSCQ